MQIILRRKDGIFSFTRDSLGHGAWYCIRGKCPGLFGRSNYGKAVPTAHTKDLTREAISQGIATLKDLAWTQKAEKSKSIRVGGRKKKKAKTKASLLGGSFNPFESSLPGIEDNFGLENGASVRVTSRSQSRHEDADSTGFFSGLFSSQPDDAEESGDEQLVVEEVSPELIGQ